MSERRTEGRRRRCGLSIVVAGFVALAALVANVAIVAPLAAQTAPAPGPSPTVPLTLRRAVELAVAQAPEVAVALAAEREGAATARLAEDARGPAAALKSNPGYVHGLPLAVAGGIPSLAGAEVRQTLYDPARRAELAESRAGAATARGGTERARREAARAAADLYARCWADRKALASAAGREEAYGREGQQVRARLRAGRATDLEAGQARLREGRGRLKRLEVESQRDADDAALRRLLGWPEETPIELGDDPLAALPAPPPAGGLAAARAADPELAALDRAIEIRRQAAVAFLAPSVEAGAAYWRLFPSQYEPFYRSPRADDWSVGLSLTLPIPLGRRAADGRERQQAALDRLTSERRARETELALAVRQAEGAMARAAAAADLAHQASELATDALRVARALAAEGRVADDEVASRAADVADAADEESQSAAGLAQARAALLALRGELPGASAPAPAVPATK